MKRGIFTFFFLVILCFNLSAQLKAVEGIVISQKDAKPVSSATIFVKSSLKGTFTDSLGRFMLKPDQEWESIMVTCVGYEPTVLLVETGGFAVVRLVPLEKNLSEIIVKPTENPAWEIIRKVLHNRSKNDPQKYPGFQGSSYSKVTIDYEGLNYKLLKDSSKYLRDRTLFIMENAGDLYQKYPNQKEIVRHTVSNFPRFYPANLLVTQGINPFGFYAPFFQLRVFGESQGVNPSQLKNERFYLNPINPDTFRQYDFTLVETSAGKIDTTFKISFKPYAPKTFDGLKGYLKISSDGFAIRELEAANADSFQVFDFKLYQRYEKINHRWFPVERKSHLSYHLNNKRYNGNVNYVLENVLFNIKPDYVDPSVIFDGATRVILPKSDTINYLAFQKFRPVNISEKYLSIYDTAELNRKPKLKKVFDVLVVPVKIFISGAYETDRLQWLFKETTFNYHEWLRLAVGVQNNLSKDPRWRWYGNVGYGVKDGTFKYAGSLAYHVTKDRLNRFEVFYKEDIERPGKTTFLKPNFMIPGENPLLIGKEEYLLDHYKRMGMSFYFRPFSWSQIQVFGQKEYRTPVQYQLNGLPDYEVNSNQVGVNFRYARKETMTRYELMENVQNRFYPILRFQFIKGLPVKGSFESNNFWKTSVDVIQQIRTRKIGSTYLVLSGGMADGDIPFPYLFNNLSVPSRVFGKNTIGDFQSMDLTSYAYNHYVSAALNHNFGKTLLRSNKKWFQPEFSIGNKVAWSRLTQKPYVINHEIVSDFGDGFYEANLTVKNFFRIKLLGTYIGIGGTAIYSYSRGKIESSQFRFAPVISPSIL